MAYYTGMTRTSHAITADRVVREVDQTLILEPDARVAPFLWLCRQNRKPTGNPKFESMYMAQQLRKDTVQANITSAATSVVVANAGQFRVYDTAFNPRTFESIFITDVDRATNTLTIVRGNGTTAAAMNAADELYVTGSASPEGDSRLSAVGQQPTFDYNYTEIFRHSVEVSRTQLNTDEYGPNDVHEEKRRKWNLMMMEIEARFLTGGRHIINSGDDVIRFTQGLIPALGTGAHVLNQAGNILKSELDAYLEPRFSYGSDTGTKVGLCNLMFLRVLNQMVESFLEKDMDAQTAAWGWKFVNYNAYYGTLKCHESRLLTRMFPTTAVCAVIDPPFVRCRYLRNSDIAWYMPDKDTQLIDGVIGEWLCEMGLEVKTDPNNPTQSPHGWLYGITGFGS